MSPWCNFWESRDFRKTFAPQTLLDSLNSLPCFQCFPWLNPVSFCVILRALNLVAASAPRSRNPALLAACLCGKTSHQFSREIVLNDRPRLIRETALNAQITESNGRQRLRDRYSVNPRVFTR
jgi:hypothetical protein